jgi:hypothetical protein
MVRILGEPGMMHQTPLMIACLDRRSDYSNRLSAIGFRPEADSRTPIAVNKGGHMAGRKKKKGRRKVGRKKRRMRSKIRHRKG